MKFIYLAFLVLLFPIMSNAEQKILLPQSGDLSRLIEQRAVVERFLPEEAKEKYKTAAGKLGLIRAILTANKFKKEQTYELQCLGIVFGDVMVQELGMEWIIVEDEYGRDPAVRLPKTDIIVYPLTMISKRIERGEEVDVFNLFNGLAAKLDEVKGQKK